MNKFSIKDFKGVIPATLTIFDKNEEIDETETRKFIRFLLKFNIGGFYLTGSTGEGFLMSLEERKRVVEIVMDEVKGQVPVVVHVGAISTKLSIELAKHAEKVGATGISSVPPFYWRFTEEQIFNYYKDIAESTSLPMIVYNVPLVGMMSVGMIKKLSTIDNVAGVKYTGTTLFECTQIMDACGKDFLVYGGCDEMAASNVNLGVDGIIGSFYNIVPDLFLDIYNTSKKGEQDKAEALQRNAVRIIMNVLSHNSMTAAMKVCLKHADICEGYSRKPFTNFTPEQENEIIESLLALKKEYNIENIEILDRLAK